MKKFLKMVGLYLLFFVIVQNSAFSQETNIYLVAYINRLQNKVETNWSWCNIPSNKRIIIVFDVDKNGKLKSVKIAESSGDKGFDAVALNAISKSEPFGEIPKSIKEENLSIRFIFSSSGLDAALMSNVLSNNNTQAIQNANLVSQDSDINQENLDNEVNKTNFRPCMKKIQKKIKSNWHPCSQVGKQNAVAIFKIDKNGQLLDLKILKSSGVQKFDEDAISAIYKTAPFQKLPNSFKGELVTVVFNFNYNGRRSNNYLVSDLSSPVSKILLLDHLVWWSCFVVRGCQSH